VSKNFAIAMGIGLVVVAIAVFGIVRMQHGAQVDLQGKFLKVRTAPLDDNSSLVVVDYRSTNKSSYPFMVRNVTLIMEDNTGRQTEGQTASDIDANRALEGMPILGPKYNQTLKINDKIPPQKTWDNMLVARMDVPDDKLAARARFILKLEEVDGAVMEIREK
jgi:hypothetical protein